MTFPRRRPPRSVSAVEFHLQSWTDAVLQAELAEPNVCLDCPACTGDEGRRSRDRLESIIRRGGKQGRRVSASVRALDERFEDATYPVIDARSPDRWWWQRRWE